MPGMNACTQSCPLPDVQITYHINTCCILTGLLITLPSSERELSALEHSLWKPKKALKGKSGIFQPGPCVINVGVYVNCLSGSLQHYTSLSEKYHSQACSSSVLMIMHISHLPVVYCTDSNSFLKYHSFSHPHL